MEKTKLRYDDLDYVDPINPEFDARKYWIESLYPLTVIADRYNGTYSGGSYVAFPVEYWKIPADGPDGSDIPCDIFWNNYIGYVGLGASVDEAIEHLKYCIDNKIHYDEVIRKREIDG